MKVFNKEGNEVLLVESKELNIRDYIGYIGVNSTFEFDIELNHSYLISIFNTYNANCLFFVGAGDFSINASVAQLAGNMYFSMSSIGKTKLMISSGEANGNVYALRLS